MCRSIKPLANFEPPATHEEVSAAALQFVRKVSGFTKPSVANRDAFAMAVHRVTEVMEELLPALTSKAPPRNREIEAQKARQRSAARFSTNGA